MADNWISPTGFEDIDEAWIDEIQAYDEDTLSAAKNGGIPINSWGNLLELTHAPLNCDKVRFHAVFHPSVINAIDLDVYYGDAWHHVYQGVYTTSTWEEKPLGGTYLVTAARVKFYNDFDEYSRNAYIQEFDFNEVEAPPPTRRIFITHQ